MNLVQISQNLLVSVKTNKNSQFYIQKLKNVSRHQLIIDLNSDNKKKVFWINIYNAYVLILLEHNPKIILKSFPRKIFFNKKQINIGRKLMSLNYIEHSLLRKSKVWWGRGYIKKWFISDYEKQFGVEKLDVRIHFALNCGGEGCPPIRFYSVEKINNQLEIATQAFLFSEVKQNKKQNTLKISELFNWYLGDFGGRLGLIKFFKTYQVLPEEENPTIFYTKYNWRPWIKY